MANCGANLSANLTYGRTISHSGVRSLAREPNAAPQVRRRPNVPAPAPVARENWLLFIDTNILLDFYRLGVGSSDRQLRLLEKHRGSLILTNQVWMEFLKNRQKVIMGTMKDLKKPDKMSFPPIVAGYQPAKTAQAQVDVAIKSHAKVKQKIEAILRDPAHNDPVYKALKRIFEASGTFVVGREHPDRFKIRSLARKRSVLGYPPRKDSDVSVGDAVNWEWIIHCAKKSADLHNIIIVSRDNDYGITIGEEGFLNDWLRKEFKERVSRKRKIVLTQKLTVALKKLDEVVRPEDEQEEARVIEKNPYFSQFTLDRSPIDPDTMKVILDRIRSDFGTPKIENSPHPPADGSDLV